ncbi:MAG: AAA family ATPase [Proteobacteria bacterium]|nr:AAA family ATPase [Pseudomonadota bacterium]
MLLRIKIQAFLLHKGSVAAVESLKEDRLFFRSTFDIQEGGIDKAITYLADKTTPALLIVETAATQDKMFEQLEALANVCAPETQLLLIGAQNDIELFRTLIAEGISDYLISPATGAQLKDSMHKIFMAGPDSGNDGRVIAFAGMTGGAGSSVLSHNVAHELAAIYDEQVMILDLDISYGTAALDYNQQPRQTIVDALTQTGNLDAATLNQYFQEFGETKLSVLGSPASLSTGLQITSQPLEALMKVVKPMAEFIILDIPHMWDTWINDSLAAADEVVLVCRPDLTNLRNAKNVVEYLGPKRGVDAPTRLILNKTGEAKKADLSAKDFKDALALEPALSIPYDPEAFGRALNNGEMMSKASAKSKATEGIIELAKLVSAREDDDEGDKKGLGLFRMGKKKDKDKDKK